MTPSNHRGSARRHRPVAPPRSAPRLRPLRLRLRQPHSSVGRRLRRLVLRRRSAARRLRRPPGRLVLRRARLRLLRRLPARLPRPRRRLRVLRPVLRPPAADSVVRPRFRPVRRLRRRAPLRRHRAVRRRRGATALPRVATWSARSAGPPTTRTSSSAEAAVTRSRRPPAPRRPRPPWRPPRAAPVVGRWSSSVRTARKVSRSPSTASRWSAARRCRSSPATRTSRRGTRAFSSAAVR